MKSLTKIIAAAVLGAALASSPAKGGVKVEFVPKTDCYNAYFTGITGTYWLNLEDTDGDRNFDKKSVIGPGTKEELDNMLEELKDIKTDDGGSYLQRMFRQQTEPYCPDKISYTIKTKQYLS